MLDAKTRAALSRSDLVSHHLRVFALLVDPANGHLVKLAEALDVHATTLSAWSSQGYIPHFQCKKMVKRFGAKAVPLDDLCPEEFRTP